MAKTQEELNAIKEDVETLNNKLAELTDEELEQVSGGGNGVTVPDWLRLDGSLCREDCCGVHDRDSCGYTFCKWDRWRP